MTRSYRITIAEPTDYLMVSADGLINAFRKVLGPGVRALVRQSLVVQYRDWSCTATGTDFELLLSFEGRAGRLYLDQLTESLVRELEVDDQPHDWVCLTGTSHRGSGEDGGLSAPLGPRT